MKANATLMFFFLASISMSQPYSAQQLLDKTIEYHDKNANWESLNATLEFRMIEGDKAYAITTTILNTKGFFRMEGEIEGDKIMLQVHNDQCVVQVNGSNEISVELMKKHQQRFSLNQDGARSMRDFWLYTLGLPMKLKDNGTVLDEEILKKSFNEEEVWQLNVNYPNDQWQYFIDPNSYQLKGYQFTFKNNGFSEYVILKDETEVQGVKLAKQKNWHLAAGQYMGKTELVGFKVIEQPDEFIEAYKK